MVYKTQSEIQLLYAGISLFFGQRIAKSLTDNNTQFKKLQLHIRMWQFSIGNYN